MKKQYETPKAKKVEFNYEENVVASGTPSKDSCTCGCGTSTKDPGYYFWFYVSCKWW